MKGNFKQALCERLALLYGAENLGNKEDPTDELFFLLLSTKTSHRSYLGCYEAIKRRFPSWEGLLSVDPEDLEEALRPCGLYKYKARLILRVARVLKEVFGKVSLDPLKEWSTEEAERFLLGLPGVGPKVAKGVLMYSLGRPVLPVDTHTHRLAYRLGLIDKPRNMRDERGKLHAELESLVPQDCRKVFHVGAVVIGRSHCLPKNPRCSSCPLNDICPKNGVI